MFRKMIYTIAGMSAMSMAMCAIATAGSFPEGTTMQKLSDKGEIRIGVKFDQPLFGLRNLRGEPEGFDVELGKIIAKSLKIEPEKITWVETVSANRETFITQDKVDMVLATYAVTPKRRDVVSFAGPYIITGQDLMVKAGNPGKINGPDDLKGKKVCVLNGSENRLNLVTNYPDAIPVNFDAFSKCAEAVKNGSVDAATLSGAVILGYVAKEPDKLEMVGNRFSDEPWGVGITKGDKDFCEHINTTINKSFEEGLFQEKFVETVGKFQKEPPVLPEFDVCS